MRRYNLLTVLKKIYLTEGKKKRNFLKMGKGFKNRFKNRKTKVKEKKLDA